MRLATLARRTVAITAATALLTAGAFSGAGIAHAVGPAPVVDSSNINPSAAFNTATATVKFGGTFFNPATDKPKLQPAFPAQPGGALVIPITGTVDPQNSTTTVLTASFALTLAAPGSYDVLIDRNDVGPGGTTTTTYVGCTACFGVTSLGAPTSTNVVFGPSPGPPTGINRGAGSLDISATNSARGASVQFLNLDCSNDGAATFVARNPNNDSATATRSGYPSSTLLQGNYTAAVGFNPGRHYLRILNTDGRVNSPTDCSVGSADFYLPYFTAGNVVPSSRGAGSVNQTVTVTGQGFRQGSKLIVANLNGGGCMGGRDVTMGTSTVSTDGTTISAPVTLQDSCSSFDPVSNVSLAGRSVTISGPDGANFSVGNAFVATAPPVVSSLNRSTLGRGGSFDLTITGTGFVAGVGGAPSTAFSFGGGGVTGVTKTVLSSSQAVVTVVAASDAILGGRSVTATNPDAGTTKLGADSVGKFPLTINPAPFPTNISPASAGKATSKSIVITGTGFDGTNGMTVKFSGTGVAAGTVTVSKGVNGAPDTATFTVNVDANAPAGLRDVTLTNLGDTGSYTCTACFGVDSLAISPASDGNTNPASSVTLTGSGMISGGSVSLLRPGADPSTAIKAPTNYVSTTQSTAVLNLLNEAPGKYNVTYTGTSDGVPLVCASCFTIAGQAPTITGINPADAGQGAINVPFTVAGTKFAKGTQVTIARAVVHDVTYVDTKTVTGLVDIPTAAATGASDVKVLTADGTFSATLAGGFTIDAGPVLKTIAPAAVGQGASAFAVTLKGTGFKLADSASMEPGTLLDLGPGITVTDVAVTKGTGTPTPTDDTLTAMIAVASNAATGLRDAVVTNSDHGRSVLVGKFTVNVGPIVKSITPTILGRGAADQAITVTGTGFAADAALTLDGVTFSSAPTVSDDGTTINGNGTVATDAARGTRDVVVTNPADKGTGKCVACFTVADLPGAPTIRSTTPGVDAVTVTWSPPADNGGSGITQYTLSADDGTSAVSAAGDQTTATLSGLTPGRLYTLTLIAQNAQGAGPGATTTATPYDVPLAPTAVSAAGGSGYVDVSWSGEDPRGNAITEYTIRYSNGPAFAEQVIPAPASSTRINGLANGTTYTFTVKAKNAAGYGAFSTVSATASATYAARLTSTRSPITALARAAVTFSGRLTRNDGTSIGGALVTVKLTPDIGNSRNVAVTTASDGTWTFRFAPTYNTTVAASFAGDSQNGATSALTYKLGVKTRVVRQSPATGQTTPAGSTLQVKGYTTPNKAGRTIALYEGTRLVARATVASNGYFTINARLPRGTHTVHVGIGTTSGNVPGDSGNFVVKRS
jgi:hypothetical protein